MSVPGPALGPCESWIDGADVVACCPSLAESSTAEELLDVLAFEASMALYELSGGRFTGLCERVVRPCSLETDCWGSRATGSWHWQAEGRQWGWRDESGPHCGCRPLSQVKLGGYPVRLILEVKIDGEVLDPLDENGNPNYRLDGWQHLTRMDDPGPPAVRRVWPGCQNLALEDTEPGTFSISYQWGVEPPSLGRRAAAALACQLALACPGAAGAAGCQLPEGTVKVQRQGITIDRQLLAGFFDRSKPTGIMPLDLFVTAYVGVPRAPVATVWSPDMTQHARRVG